jgi:uncharacterized protein (DUF2225 family)
VKNRGSVVAVNRENLISLLESAADISQKLLKTLVERAELVIEKVRQAGKPVIDLPAMFKTISPVNPQKDLENMVLLAQRIRECNDILGASQQQSDTDSGGIGESKFSHKPNTDTVMLLPPWTNRYDSEKADTNDNSAILANWDYICPYCGKGFRDKMPLFSRLDEKGRTTDGRTLYRGFNMVFYTNIVCPNCNYCDTYQEFQKILRANTNLTIKENQFKNFEKFTGFADDFKRTLDEVALSCYLNLHCLKQIGNSEFRQAKTWHRLYWLYSDFNETDSAKQAAKQALDCYNAYHDKNGTELKSEDLAFLNSIIKELSN